MCVERKAHSHDTLVHVQVIRTLPAQMFHSPREHAWLKGAQPRIAHYVVSETTCHSSVMSHMLPHLSQNILHNLSHVPQLSSDLLPHCLVPRNWIKKPCETHGGVADILNLHLPQVEVHPVSARHQSSLHQFGKKVFILNIDWIPNRRCSSKIVWKRSWNLKIHFNAGPTCKK